MLALKFPNVSLDTSVLYSGTPADSLRHVMSDLIGLDVINRSLANQIVFGSNYPRVDPKRMVDGIRSLNLPSPLSATYSTTTPPGFSLDQETSGEVSCRAHRNPDPPRYRIDRYRTTRPL